MPRKSKSTLSGSQGTGSDDQSSGVQRRARYSGNLNFHNPRLRDSEKASFDAWRSQEFALHLDQMLARLEVLELKLTCYWNSDREAGWAMLTPIYLDSPNAGKAVSIFHETVYDALTRLFYVWFVVWGEEWPDQNVDSNRFDW